MESTEWLSLSERLASSGRGRLDSRFGQKFVQCCKRIEHPALGGAQRDVEPGGDLDQGETAVIGESDNGALAFGEVGDHCADPSLILSEDDALLQGVGVGGSEALVEFIGLTTRLTARDINRSSVREDGDPGGQPGPRGIELRGVTPETEKRLLDGILAQSAIVEHAEGDGSGDALVATIRLRESDGIAGNDPTDKLEVAEGEHVLFRRLEHFGGCLEAPCFAVVPLKLNFGFATALAPSADFKRGLRQRNGIVALAPQRLAPSGGPISEHDRSG